MIKLFYESWWYERAWSTTYVSPLIFQYGWSDCWTFFDNNIIYIISADMSAVGRHVYFHACKISWPTKCTQLVNGSCSWLLSNPQLLQNIVNVNCHILAMFVPDHWFSSQLASHMTATEKRPKVKHTILHVHDIMYNFNLVWVSFFLLLKHKPSYLICSINNSFQY